MFKLRKLKKRLAKVKREHKDVVNWLERNAYLMTPESSDAFRQIFRSIQATRRCLLQQQIVALNAIIRNVKAYKRARKRDPEECQSTHS